MATKYAGRRFVILVDFKDDDLQSAYLKGLTYRVREGNDLLAKKLDIWISEGRARLIQQEAAAVSGQGESK